MKSPLRRLLSLAAIAGAIGSLHAHGVGVHLRENGETAVDEVIDTDLPADAPAQQQRLDGKPEGKSFKTPVDTAKRWWGASVTTGWESRNVHYGMDETGPGGAYINEISLRAAGFTVSAWNGIGLGNEFLEWNFTAAYQVEIGPVFLIPGYNFRYQPGQVPHSHAHDHSAEPEPEPAPPAAPAPHYHAPGTPDHHHDEPATPAPHDQIGDHNDGDHDHSDHDHGDEEQEHSDHHHGTYGHELFAVIGTDAIPYVTPSATFVADLNNLPGMFLDLRIDGEVPLYKEILSLQPYAQLGLNFGYNTTDYYGWNNFQYGANLVCQITRSISTFAGIQQSVALTALRENGQGNIVWVNVGLTIAY